MTLAEFKGQGMFPSIGFMKRRPEQRALRMSVTSDGPHKQNTFICCKINILLKRKRDTSVAKGSVEKTDLLYDSFRYLAALFWFFLLLFIESLHMSRNNVNFRLMLHFIRQY